MEYFGETKTEKCLPTIEKDDWNYDWFKL